MRLIAERKGKEKGIILVLKVSYLLVVVVVVATLVPFSHCVPGGGDFVLLRRLQSWVPVGCARTPRSR